MPNYCGWATVAADLLVCVLSPGIAVCKAWECWCVDLALGAALCKVSYNCCKHSSVWGWTPGVGADWGGTSPGLGYLLGVVV